ncbi:MAG: GNAT family N-acetyltransferase [Solirubrobacteraceae bacterium]
MEGVEVVDVRRGRRRAAARVLTEAFLHDPAWVAVGPRRERDRRRLLRRFFGVALFEAGHWGGPTWAAARGGTTLGVAVTFAEGEKFPPAWASALESPLFLLAGRETSLHGAQVGAAMARAHPRQPHLYLWFLAAHPDHQRRGIGRALMHRVLDEAARRALPVYLETATPSNIPYYRSFGFEVTGETVLPSHARMWFMWRPAPDEASHA